MVTDQAGRLMGYTCNELAAYTCEQLNSLPYGIKRAMAAAEGSAAARGETLSRAQDAAERVDLIAYSALETAVGRLSSAADKLLSSLQ